VLAGREPRQQRLALSLGAGAVDQQRGRHRRQERDRRERSPELLAEDRQLDAAEPLPAAALRQRDPEPAQLAQLLPQRRIGRPRLGALAHPLRPGTYREQLAGGATDLLLVL
jgi:hypothetical protein